MGGEQETYDRFKVANCSKCSKAFFARRLDEAFRRSIGIDRLSQWLIMLYVPISQFSCS